MIAIVSLALGPFAQQVIQYRTRVTAHPSLAGIPRALNYTGALPGNSSLSMVKSLTYNNLI